MPGFLRPLLLILGAVALVAAALFAVSRGALPGAPLYPVKSVFEEARVTLTFGVFPKARWYVTLAERRTAEGKALAKAEQPERAIETLNKVGGLVGIAYKFAGRLTDDSQRDEITRRGEETRREADQVSRDLAEASEQEGER